MNTTTLSAFAVALALGALGCMDFEPPAGRLACTTAADCPSGWTCAADSRCYPAGDPSDAGADGGGLEDGGQDDAGTDAGVCDDPCGLVPQCGCPAGRACYPDNGLTTVSCQPAGTVGEGEVCGGPVNSCAPGLLCVRYTDTFLCIRVCSEDGDCVGGDGSLCARELSGGFDACTFSCDLVDQDCAEGFRCEPGRVPPSTEQNATDCIQQVGSPTGGFGDACSSTTQDCAPGYSCANGQCLPYCRLGDACPGGNPCAELSPLVRIGEQEFGVCPPT